MLKPSLENNFRAAAVLLAACVACASPSGAQEKAGGKNRPAPALTTAAPAARPAAAPQAPDGGEAAGNDDQFREEVGSAGGKIRESMDELRRGRKPFHADISPEARARAAVEERVRYADYLEAGLRKAGVWGTDSAWQSVGMVSYLRGDYAAAIPQFTRAIERAPEPSVKTWLTVDRGEAHFASGDRAAAARDLDAAMKMDTPDKGPGLAELAWKLGRIDDARREAQAAAAYRRTQTPGYVANWSVCNNLEVVGKPAAGCLNRAISECFRLYGTPEFSGTPGCSGYGAEMKFLKNTGYPCPGKNCGTAAKQPAAGQ